MNTRARRTTARLGLLATTLALAAALVVGSWLNYRAAQSAVSTLNRGQADILTAALREAMRTGAEADTTILHALLDRYADDGLRYIALFDPRRNVRIAAGVPVAPVTPLPGNDSMPGTLPLVSVGDRVRAFAPVARRPPMLEAPGGRGPDEARHRGGQDRQPSDEPDPQGETGGAGDRRDGATSPRESGDRPFIQIMRRRAPLYMSILEFEPVVASTLVNGATRSMVLAGVAATILTLAALLFWRKSERYDRALLRLEQQKRLTVLGEMSAVLAHEMRNPLASLKGHAQLLAERLPSDSRERAKADRVIGEAQRLEALTSDLLDFARAGPLELRAVDPLELVKTSIGDVADDAFELDAATAPDHWTIDAPRVRQALVNLLDNAHQSTTNGARPRVRVTQEDGQLVFEVRDFGPGLPPGSEMRVFDPFFTTRTNGTGLGLAVARRVAELHGGQITAHNHPEGGAIFRFELPRND